MSTAAALTRRMDATGRSRSLSKAAIYAIAADDFNVHCLTEDQIDAWWRSLGPERKAELYEADLDGVLYETVALAHPEVADFQAHVDRFFSDMQLLQKSPFTGLTKDGN